MTRPKVSVIIPTMNEEASIGEVLGRVRGSLEDLGWPYEILVVDTNSRDRTEEIARGLGATVVPEPRRGYGRAYKSGFAKAQGEFIVTLDADATYPPERIPDLLRLVERGGCDFVLGDRMSALDPRAMGLKHRLGNFVLNVAVRLLFRLRLRDTQSGMWAFRASILDRLELLDDGMAFSEELKVEAARKGFRLQEVPIAYGLRVGEPKLRSWADGWGNLKFLLKKRFLGRRMARRASPPVITEQRQ